jgi:integrase/recombinase XerD
MIDQHANRPRVMQMSEPFLKQAAAQRCLTGESINKYRELLRYFVREVGNIYVDEITPDLLAEFQRRKSEASVGPSHLNGVVYAVKKMVEHCRVVGVSGSDLGAVRPLPVPRQKVEYLTEDEFEQFARAIPVQRCDGQLRPHTLGFRALVEMLVGSGMRLSEALSLNITDIRWNDQEATIVGKGGKRRTVFFTDRVLRWLRRYLDNRGDRNPALFVTGNSGRRLTRHEAQRLCRKYVAVSRLHKRISCHTLRHTYATTLLKNGCPVGHIKGLLGHERLETTCRFYLGALQDDELKKAHKRFLELST